MIDFVGTRISPYRMAEPRKELSPDWICPCGVVLHNLSTGQPLWVCHWCGEDRWVPLFRVTRGATHETTEVRA